MGGPMNGECYLIYNNKRLKLNGLFGGPVIWLDTSEKVALPIWTMQKKQKIGIVDLNEITLTTYKKECRVLHFEKFTKNILSGIDSPAYMPTKLHFNIDKEEIEAIEQIEKKFL